MSSIHTGHTYTRTHAHTHACTHARTHARTHTDRPTTVTPCACARVNKVLYSYCITVVCLDNLHYLFKEVYIATKLLTCTVGAKIPWQHALPGVLTVYPLSAFQSSLLSHTCTVESGLLADALIALNCGGSCAYREDMRLYTPI